MTEKSGYTLIEILLVLALFSILLSMIVPNLEIYKDMIEVSELNRLKKDLLFFRNSAILEGIDYYVNFDYNSNSYYLKSNKSDKIIKRVYFKNGIKLNNRSEKVSFKFNRNGTVGNSNTLMLKTRKNERLKLVLTPVTGKISVEKVK